MAEKTVTLYLSGYDTSDYAYASASDLANPIGKPSSNDTCATIDLATGSNATTYIYYFFDTSSIPDNAEIISISCTAKGYVSSKSVLYVSSSQMQLFCGTTAKGSSVNLTTTPTAHTIDAGTWTRDELNNCRLRLYAQRAFASTSSSRTMQLYGAELTVTYDAPEIVPIIGSVAVGNVAKTLKGGHIPVEGVLKPLVKSYTNINNVWLPTFGYRATVHVWKKYTTNTTRIDGWTWGSTEYTVKGTDTSKVTVYTASPVASGVIKVQYGDGTLDALDTAATPSTVTFYQYMNDLRSDGTEHSSSYQSYIKFVNPESDWSNGSYVPNPNYIYKENISDDYNNVKVTPPVYSPSYNYSQGSYIEDVTSSERNAYPTNGRHSDGFWYVFQG